MSTNEDLILRLSYMLQGGEIPRQEAAQIAHLETATKKTNEALGMNRREWMQMGTEASFYLTMVAGKSGEAGQRISQLTGMISQLGESFMFGGGVGLAIAGVGTAISFIISQIQKAEEESRKAREELVAPFVAGRKELEQVTGKGDVLKPMLELIKANRADLVNYAKSSEDAGNQVLALSDAMNTQAQIGRRLRDAQNELANATARVDEMQARGWEYITENPATWEKANVAMNNAAATVERLTLGYGNATNAVKDLSDAIRDDLTPYFEGWMNDERQLEVLLSNSLIEKKATQVRDYTKAIQQLIDKQKDLVKGMLESAMTPTSVTSEDLTLAAAGKYVNQWDEWRRRAEDVWKNGVDPAKYGEQFKRQYLEALRKTQMTPEELTAAYKDFSLFGKFPELADELIDFDVLEKNIEQQIDSKLGKSDALSKAFQNVWKKIMQDPAKAAKLERLGITGMSDDWKRLLGIEPSELNIVPSPTFLSNLQKMRDDIVGTIPPEMYTTVYVEYKIPPAGGGGGGGAAGGGAKPTNPNGIEMFAEGGFGTFTRDQLIGVHAGEQYWIDGYGRVPPPSQTVTVNANVANGLDIERLAAKIGRAMQRRR